MFSCVCVMTWSDLILVCVCAVSGLSSAGICLLSALSSVDSAVPGMPCFCLLHIVDFA